MSSFGRHILALRKEHELPLRAVAGAVGIDQSTLSKIERNERIAPAYIIEPLAQLFNSQLDELEAIYLGEKLFELVKESTSAKTALDLAQHRLEDYRQRRERDSERDAIIGKLRLYFVHSLVEQAWLFGSFARNEYHEESDIDLLVRFKDSAELDLLDYIGLGQELQDLLQREIDLVESSQLKEEFVNVVNQEKILIYG